MENVKNAIIHALTLLYNEVDSIELESLKDEYLSVIQRLEMALNEIGKDEQMD